MLADLRGWRADLMAVGVGAASAAALPPVHAIPVLLLAIPVLLALIGLFRPGWSEFLIYGILVSGGFFRSLQFTAYNALAYSDIPRPQMSAATSFYATIQQVSMTLGVSAGAASLTISMAMSDHATPMLADFSIAFGVVALSTLLSTPVSLLMPRHAAMEVSGHAKRA